MIKATLTFLILAIFAFGIWQIFGTSESGGNSLALIFEGINPLALNATIVNGYTDAFAEGQYNTFMRNGYEIKKIVTDLNGDSRKDLIVTLNSTETCGSGGCLTHIYIQSEKREFVQMNFDYVLQSIEALNTYTENMKDLRINGDMTHKMIWNGSNYVLEDV